MNMADVSLCVAPEAVGDMWTIPNFDHSGLFSTVYTDAQETQVVHYVRQETKDLWDKLEECRTSDFEQFALLHVFGDPGSGKSTTVWGYSQFLSSTLPVAWVTQEILGYRFAWSTMESAPAHRRFAFTDYEEMLDALVRLDPALVVLDGIGVNCPMKTCSLTWMIGGLLESLTRKCFIVICTAKEGFDYCGAYLTHVQRDWWFVPGWTVQDMQAARAAAIRTGMPVLPTDLLDAADDAAFRRQLHVAGGNMLLLTIDCELAQDILRDPLLRHKWQDIWYAAKLRRGEYSYLFVHTHREGTKQFVSDFVCKEVSRLIPIVELSRAETIDSEDTVLMGMIFEVRARRIFRDAVAAGKGVTFTKMKLFSVSETFRIARIVDDSEPQSGGPAHLECITVCHIPVKRNDGCFDFALIHRGESGKYDVYFLQFAVTDRTVTHLQYAAEFLGRMFPNNNNPFQPAQTGVQSGYSVEDDQVLEPSEAMAGAPAAGVETQSPSTQLAPDAAAHTDGPAEVTAHDSAVPAGLTEEFPRMKIRVHFYFVLPRKRVRDFKLGSCKIEGIQPLQNFDPAFDGGRIRVGYISSHQAYQT